MEHTERQPKSPFARIANAVNAQFAYVRELFKPDPNPPTHHQSTLGQFLPKEWFDSEYLKNKLP